jgi:hypothetical protein
MTFALFVENLQNNISAHHFVEGFLMMPTLKWETLTICEGYGVITSKQTNTYLHIY